ncbi:RuvB-like DNA repair helicase, putative [Theileria annulata]|uniref:RuvB-like helicase n=1 Tax=Theileria annulata TaxID=5874 RepID=Q4U921_THEAN|nr:RuvB-like DNA repair helicase, putative [Theileria annulata]CAI76682.1 RuvB-like DNA repair helicase, putative [Theileria annulata]|eukprot:XP_953307.1 RuvB-like DNA repair helicase, putative [Theileria annulata]
MEISNDSSRIITEIKSNNSSKKSFNRSKERISVHSHIKGLGVHPSVFSLDTSKLNYDGKDDPKLLVDYENCFNPDCGLIGQFKAREASLIAVDMIKSKKMAGKALLLAGPSGSGKTALAMGIARELNTSAPFTILSSTEVFSTEVKKTEILNEAVRKSIHIVIKDEKQIYEGEVTELTAEEVENPTGGFAKCMNGVLVTLKTVKGSKTLRLAPQVHEQLVKEKVSIGDVIFIESGSGQVRRCGRCDVYSTEFDLEVEEYVPLPKGDVLKQKQVVQEVSLNDLDMANSNPSGGSDIVTMLNQYLRPKRTEITDKLRLEVNKAVNKYVDLGIAEVIPGVLYIDEVHMFDIECFTYLSKVMESPLSPIVILSTNRGISSVRGSDFIEAHGIPADLLDRLLIIKTVPYTIHEMVQILKIRSKVENVPISDQGLKRLGEIGLNSSLRYCIQLISPSNVLRNLEEKLTVESKHIDDADSLFMDSKTSAQRIVEQSDLFIS